MSVKYLIKQNGQIYTVSEDEWVDTGLSEPLTQQDFEEYGIVSLLDITTEKWAELGNEFEVLMWTDSLSNTHKLELTVSEYKPIYLLDSPTLLIWTVSENELQLVTDAIIKQQKRFLVSKDNRQTWWRLSYITDEENKIPQWVQVPIEDIYTDGMTKDELEAITKQEWKIWTGTAMTFNFDFAVGMEGVNVEGTNSPTITSFEVHFPPNDAPLIMNPKLMVGIYELEDGTPIHAEVVNLIATIYDQEGDQIRYKILINGKKFYPEGEEEWSEYVDNGYELTKAIQYPDLNIVNHNPDEETEYLDNEIVLIVQDDRGMERSWTGKIIVVNDTPEIVISHTDFALNGTIYDPDADKVAYRILINNKQVFPTTGDNIINDKLYTPFFEHPKDVYYQWSSKDLIFNQPNLITLETIDEFGAINQVEFSVTGTFRGLMFVDTQGNYYTSDSGEILQYLDFETIVAGTITEPKIVYLRNQNGFDVEDTIINVNQETLPSGVQVKVSKVAEPFEDKTNLVYQGVLQDGEDVYFYVRLITDVFSTQGGGVFEIRTKADPVV